MNTQEIKQWLFENGGPTIRYRTSTELMESNTGIDIKMMERAVAESQEVITWLNYLKPMNGVSHMTLHGSYNHFYENAMSKLVQLGIHAGIPELDEATLPYRTWLTENINTREVWGVFSFAIVASFLGMAGYTDNSIRTFLTNRLEVLHEFTSKHEYNIYDDASKYQGVPKSFSKSPIIKPELYENGNYRFPLIYDLYGLSALINQGDKDTVAKIKDVVGYILTPDYHNVVVHKYGVLVSANRKCYSMGWDARLPGYFGIDEGAFAGGALLIQRMELIARFPYAADYPWFIDAIKHLETFRTERGTYAFPKPYLPEKEGYWVSAAHMGLGENRKVNISRELESTFWMLKIKKSAGLL
ncbi:hypothetical protein CLHUN_04810 [Ruminiclostridium hungatei]|uniref:Uncharacterized protein n=1 Tax=Ruminiclostridium hungatei TaxID=48256 RepID=A0A1V4SRC7_RUMHU|nr:hypothetical protein [Ruminiclostridium hungatei]OPX46006.1 hypothetical protein CLHUN_04810 [Ruminiclostridium hungatei]